MIYTIEECVPSDVGVLAEVYLPTSSIAPPTENYHGACSREELLLMLNATVLWIFSRHDPGFRKEKHELEAVNSTTDEIAAYAVRFTSLMLITTWKTLSYVEGHPCLPSPKNA